VVVDTRQRAAFGTLLVYLGSTALYLYLLGRSWNLRLAVARRDALVVGGLVVAYLAAAAWFAGYPGHFHYDEVITAYASATLPPPTQLDPFAGFPAVGQWVCQFPIVFFALQWPFMAALGPSLEAIRVSVWPYLALSAVYLYALSGRYVRTRSMRAIAVVAFAFLAPNLYLASLGVHFHSSVLFMLACLYHYERAAEMGSRPHAALAGLWLGLSFLTYTASFLALPALVAFVALGFAFRRGPSFGVLARIAAGFAVVMLPWAVYAYTWKDYFVERPDQVGGALKSAATNGTLDERAGKVGELLWGWLSTNARAVYEPGLGGVTDYDFGHRAMLDPFTLALLGFGTLVAVYRVVRTRDDSPLRPLVVVVLGFVLGMVLTQPAGAFHRTIVVFPFVGLLVAMGLEPFGELLGRWQERARPALPLVGTAAFVVVNWLAVDRMIQLDGPKPSVAIAHYLLGHAAQGAHVTISADPVFHLQRELYFRTGDRFAFRTGWFPDVAPTLGDGPVVVYAPQADQIAQLRERFPDWTFVSYVDGMELDKYLIVMPPGAG
jgi:4-amino-4-deoxy-L-arabinose transferase-like glycosyltransferase